MPTEVRSASSKVRNPYLRLFLLVASVIGLAAAANHLVAAAIGVGVGATYRRIGPTSGPQVLCVGSSVLQYSLDWRSVSALLGLGVEHTNVAGSTPEIWEVFQLQAANIGMTIVGVSPYDINEYRISRGHATIVPLSQTLRDLRDSDAGWAFSRRVLAEYPMAYVRLAFPAAGNADAVMVGLRRLARQALGLSGAAEDAARVIALPKEPVLDFAEDEPRLSDLPRDRVLRRLSLVRAENRGLHSFIGPKRAALHRIMSRADRVGPMVLVVLPMSSDYRREFLSPRTAREFEEAVTAAHRCAPGAVVVRLDRIPELQSDEYFTDFVHLNRAGRAIATSAFAEAVRARMVLSR